MTKNSKSATTDKDVSVLIADSIDIHSFRDELSSMEHPFFALQSGDTKVRVYENKDVTMTVRPAVGIGMATVFDKDIWIYALSKLQKAVNEDVECSRVIAFTAYDYLKNTNRSIGGKSYKDLDKSLERLLGTSIKTNIVRTDGAVDEEGFNLIERYRIVNHPDKSDATMIEITLPDWLYSSIVSHKKVLKIGKEYFQIRKAVDRRVYEIARKFCGNNQTFSITLDKLQLRVGSLIPMSKFRAQIKSLALKNNLPDYVVLFDVKSDIVTFNKRNDVVLEQDTPSQKKVPRKRKKDPTEVNEVDNEIPYGFRGA